MGMMETIEIIFAVLLSFIGLIVAVKILTRVIASTFFEEKI